MGLTKIKADGLTADLIDETKLADNSIDSEHYNDGSIDEAHIADDAVTADKLANAINTDIAAKAVLTGSTNNTICTVTGANAIAGESTLTYDGAGQLSITGNSAGDGLSITNDGDHYTQLSMDADRGSAANALGIIQGKWNNNSVCSIYLQSGSDTSNKDDGQIAFNTSAASSSQATRMVVKNNGNVEISDGDLVIGTSGHGIDFSATGDHGGMSSEILDTYEEGTWTPQIYYQDTTNQGDATNLAQYGWYTVVGNICHLGFFLRWTLTGSAANDNIGVKNIPFTISAITSTYGHAGAVGSTSHSGTGLSSDDPISLRASSNGTSILYLQDVTSNGNYGNEFGANSGMRIWGSITYRI